jgi:cyclic beta-1,2-glucan synthetase
MDSPAAEPQVADRTPAAPAADHWRDPAAPVRDVPFSVEHLESHARELARHEVTLRPLPDDERLWKRFESNSEALEKAYAEIVAVARGKEDMTSGAEWLLDNFYIVRDHIREIHEDLPRQFYRELPKLKQGVAAGRPRVYELAAEIIAHSDSALDMTTLARAVRAYQEVAPLTMGEVWAMPIMLRLVLVENLRRLADRILESLVHKRNADAWADEILERRPVDPPSLLADRTRDLGVLPTQLVAHLVRRFRDQGHELSECWHWLERRLSQQGSAIDDVVRNEHQCRAHDQVSTGNAVTSMRLISAVDWAAFFEEISLVERELRQDPAGVYAKMDFASRDRYRHLVEKLARRAEYEESDVARRVVGLARRCDGDDLRGHVGYYLIDEGRGELEHELRLSPSWRTRLSGSGVGRAAALYFGLAALLWATAEAGVVGFVFAAGGPWYAALAALLIAALPLSEICLGVVNHLATLVVPPTKMARMEFKEGIPESCRTMVVIPTLLTGRKSIEALAERLEMHFLANPEPQLYFALLTDFPDAPQENMPGDDALLAEALARIEALSERYEEEGRRFFLLHRPRRWNPSEGVWMGWERKRGKLADFNRLLHGRIDGAFVGPVPSLPAGIRYVLTLDSDTQLPPGAARRLIGVLAHPLNKPRFAGDGPCVTRGYSILQPRVAMNPVGARRSWFARIYTGNPQVDPYVTAVSDVYQDCFGEGSFTGKGLYDVEAFERALGDAFPENTILSHDLIEGCHARAGLVTDVEVSDDFPAQYHAFARRAHRWIRGDWQLLPWLGRSSPYAGGMRPNRIGFLSRWKVIDNLRRSLVPPALVVMWVVGWLMMPAHAWFWTLLGLMVTALPLLLQGISALLHLHRGVPLLVQLRTIGDQLRWTALYALSATAFMPHQAYLSIDAIVRTFVRRYSTRRNLLQWETASAVEGRLAYKPEAFVREMWPAAAAAGVGLLLVALAGDWRSALASVPLLVGWSASPWIAYLLGSPVAHPRAPLTEAQRLELRGIAYRTWRFFDSCVGAVDHWLPPDNFQEDPKGVIAHRTSPTNEGVYLTSLTAAYDFGYLDASGLLLRIERNLDSWESLEHDRGHPYNWYDTEHMTTLPPAYVSTVDSGNLMACALTVRQALFETAAGDLVGPRAAAGLVDIVRDLLAPPLPISDVALQATSPEAAAEADTPSAGGSTTRKPVGEVPAWVAEIERTEIRTPHAWAELLARVEGNIAGLGDAWSPVRRRVEESRGEFSRLFPWLAAEGATGRAPAGPTWTYAESIHSLREPYRKVWRLLDARHSLVSAAALAVETASAFDAVESALAAATAEDALRHEARRDLEVLRGLVISGSKYAAELLERLQALAERLRRMALAMDFTFLYDRRRHLFSIGFNAATGQLDRSHYDLLASEARLASYLAIGKGDVDHQHWFHLGRRLTDVDGKSCLLSWGGTMFEFLMPNLFLKAFPDTLITQSCDAAVERQQKFGRDNGVPWGVSESAFATFDNQMNYQYRSFGVPGLGLKRGLAEDLVIAPYAAGLAVMIRPEQALANLRRYAEIGAFGQYGFYESIDYSTDRRGKDKTPRIVRCYFAHHQGMLFGALANTLFDDCLRRRFHREPMVRSVEMLLQERIPHGAPITEAEDDEAAQPPLVRDNVEEYSRWLSTPHTAVPRALLLSNSRYTVMLTNAGGGYSTCKGTRITRWRSDSTCDGRGQFLYIRDLDHDGLWSAGHQPTCKEADEYEVLFSVDKAEFRRKDGDVETHLEIAVSPDNDVEVRLLSISNRGERTRTLEIASYVELVLGSAEADAAHPAFQKLFVETEFVPAHCALLARRRPRSRNEKPLFAMHVAAFEGDIHHRSPDDICYETDRARFIGRGRTPRNPAALTGEGAASGTTGVVLDPVFSLRRIVKLLPGQTIRMAFSTGFAATREEVLNLADQYHDLRMVLRAFELAWAQSQVELRHLRLTAGAVHVFQRLGSLLMYPDPEKRAPAAVLRSNKQGQPGLWRFGISGDYPILVVRIADAEQESLLREALLAHELWRARELVVELVVLNEYPTSYIDAVQEQLHRVVGESRAWGMLNKRGGVFVLQGTRLSDDDRALLLTAASVVLDGGAGSLERQLESKPQLRRPLDYPAPTRSSASGKKRTADDPPQRAADDGRGAADGGPSAGEFANGLGRFEREGAEYVIRLEGGRNTPQPWANVIAQPNFGSLVTESGLGFTWSENSRENRLTGWTNDPVGDPPTEAVYVRDDDTGEFWTPTPLPVRDDGPYVIRHGQGYSIFEHEAGGIAQKLHVGVAADEPIKIVRLQLRNLTGRVRRISATYAAEWVLGVAREQTQLHVVTAIDERTGALTATNAYNHEFAGRIAFLHCVGREQNAVGDRREFLGRNGDWTTPAGMRRRALSGTVGAGLDPVGVVRTSLTLEPGGEAEIVFLLGQARDRRELDELLARYQEPRRVTAVADEARHRWDKMLGALQVRTPNRAFDVLVNRWLWYQSLACRCWGRSAFYQSSGAYGYRDQLQDAMGLVYSRPDLAREQILLHASRQFEQGDVQHWWHPPTGRGVRTRFSDDFLWLPFVTAHYVRTTGDAGILEATVPYLRSALLEPQEHERYELPEVSSQVGTVYEHCLRAIENGRKYGEHGLPLMGGGDWNDGMNEVGIHGKGESVWVAWFQITIFEQFARLADARGETERVEHFNTEADRLRQAIEKHAWDGRWYRRAWFDDGTPLGSVENDACRIDSLAQSWAVMAGGRADHVLEGLRSAWDRLVRVEDGIALLFEPPFDDTPLEPGYIKGYVPGVRENGGQYTHAALWLVQALALAGDADRAMQLFDLLNPILHAVDESSVRKYQVEPYVVAADVYGAGPHVGRGGWTWYTGSAAWMYRVALETLLGFELLGDRLRVEPRIPAAWEGFELTYRRGRSTYRIAVENPERSGRGVRSVEVDGRPAAADGFPLVDDGATHEVRVVLGPVDPPSTMLSRRDMEKTPS